MFLAGLLLIIRRYYSVCTVQQLVYTVCHAFMLAGSWQDPANSQSTYMHHIRVHQFLYIQSSTS